VSGIGKTLFLLFSTTDELFKVRREEFPLAWSRGVCVETVTTITSATGERQQKIFEVRGGAKCWTRNDEIATIATTGFSPFNRSPLFKSES